MPFQPRLLMAPLSLAVRLLLPRRSAVAVMLVMRPCLPVSTAFPPVQPIWLMEFSCGDQGAQPVSKQQSYMKDALDYLENEPTIFRYAWFSGRTTALANVDLLAGAGALTTLGGDYVSLPEPAACFR
jgi:Glycosyl hydrolase catalytic core